MKSRETRTPLVVGMIWVSRISAFGIQIALCSAGGYLLDRRFETLPWGTLIGTALGFTIALIYLLRVVQTPVDN